MTDAERIAALDEKRLISSVRILVMLRPGGEPRPGPADLCDPPAGYRWQTDREYLAMLEMQAARAAMMP